jgi:hypothetical protein
MNIYDKWLEIKRKHHLESHTEGNYLQGTQGDLSCEIYYGKNQNNQWKYIKVSEEFEEFWRIINKVIEGLELNGYNWIIINGFYGLMPDREIDEEQKNKIL